MIATILISVALMAWISAAVFRTMNAPADYVESDEWEIADWQDTHKALQAWRNDR